MKRHTPIKYPEKPGGMPVPVPSSYPPCEGQVATASEGIIKMELTIKTQHRGAWTQLFHDATQGTPAFMHFFFLKKRGSAKFYVVFISFAWPSHDAAAVLGTLSPPPSARGSCSARVFAHRCALDIPGQSFAPERRDRGEAPPRLNSTYVLARAWKASPLPSSSSSSMYSCL
jgi:hypothetical protein